MGLIIHNDFLINEEDLERDNNLDLGKDLALVSWYQDQTILVISNPEISSHKKIPIQMPEPLSKCTCIVQMPNDQLFCFGNIEPFSGITCIISTKDLTCKLLPSWKAFCCSGGAYYHNSVYIFGGFRNSSEGTAMNFDFDKNNWKLISSLPSKSIRCSCTVFFGNILICGYDHASLYVYSITIDSYSKSKIKFRVNNDKYVFSGNQRGYVIIKSGEIYESEFKNPYVWDLIGKNELYGHYQMNKIKYDNFVYFGSICSSDDTFYFYFVFDLTKKKITKKKYLR